MPRNGEITEPALGDGSRLFLEQTFDNSFSLHLQILMRLSTTTMQLKVLSCHIYNIFKNSSVALKTTKIRLEILKKRNFSFCKTE